MAELASRAKISATSVVVKPSLLKVHVPWTVTGLGSRLPSFRGDDKRPGVSRAWAGRVTPGQRSGEGKSWGKKS